MTADYDGDYIILATDPSADDAVEVHLAQWDDHDPQRTAGVVYLRVRDAAALYERLKRELEADGRLLPRAGRRASPTSSPRSCASMEGRRARRSSGSRELDDAAPTARSSSASSTRPAGSCGSARRVG